MGIPSVEISNDVHALGLFSHINEPPIIRFRRLINGIAGYSSITYRGLSGIRRDPTARIVPITHWMKSGIRHDKSLSIKEQK
jgi:hypothetical protein